jgi:hypothetical protein
MRGHRPRLHCFRHIAPVFIRSVLCRTPEHRTYKLAQCLKFLFSEVGKETNLRRVVRIRMYEVAQDEERLQAVSGTDDKFLIHARRSRRSTHPDVFRRLSRAGGGCRNDSHLVMFQGSNLLICALRSEPVCESVGSSESTSDCFNDRCPCRFEDAPH